MNVANNVPIATFGSFVQEVIHFFQLRSEPKDADSKFLPRNWEFLALTILMVICSGVGAWLLYSEQEPPNAALYTLLEIVVAVGLLTLATFAIVTGVNRANRCIVFINIAQPTSTLTTSSGGTISVSATYTSSKGHGFTANMPTITMVHINPTGGSFGSGATHPNMVPGALTPNAGGGQDMTFNVNGPYVSGSQFVITVTMICDSGHSGTKTVTVIGR